MCRSWLNGQINVALDKDHLWTLTAADNVFTQKGQRL